LKEAEAAAPSANEATPVPANVDTVQPCIEPVGDGDGVGDTEGDAPIERVPVGEGVLVEEVEGVEVREGGE